MRPAALVAAALCGFGWWRAARGRTSLESLSPAARQALFDEALHDKPRWLILNKLDLIPEEERDARVKAFIKAYRWKGPVFAIAAISGDGCRPLTFAIQEWLDARPAYAMAVNPDAPADDSTPVVVKPAPVRARRARKTTETDAE